MSRYSRRRRALQPAALRARAGLGPRLRHRRATRASAFKFTIRPATLRDYAGLCSVFLEGDTMHSTALPDVFQPTGGQVRSREYVAEIISGEDSAVFVAEQERQIVGAVIVLIRESAAIPVMVQRRFAVIDNVVVRREFRRRAIGTALVEQAQRWARAKDVTQIELNVWEFNRAGIAFHEKLGYRTVSRRMRKQLH